MQIIAIILYYYIYIIIYRGKTKASRSEGRWRTKAKDAADLFARSSPLFCSVCCPHRPHHRQPLIRSHHKQRRGKSWHPAARPLSGGVRQYAEAPRQGGDGRQDEREGIARPGWLSALPSPPDGGEEDGEEDEAGRMTDRTRRCPSGCWSIGGEVVAMASTQSRAGCPLFPLLCWWCDLMSCWRWCGR